MFVVAKYCLQKLKRGSTIWLQYTEMFIKTEVIINHYVQDMNEWVTLLPIS